MIHSLVVSRAGVLFFVTVFFGGVFFASAAGSTQTIRFESEIKERYNCLNAAASV
jgi:hypothetical protein